jgi:hypothetical protein
MTQRNSDTQSAPDTRLDSDVQAHIGRQLRAGYVDILNQPVPDRFLELLAQLDQREEQSGPSSTDGALKNCSR